MKLIERGADPKMLWAFFYPWYHVKDWESPKLKDRPIASFHPILRPSNVRSTRPKGPVLTDSFPRGGVREPMRTEI